MYFVIDIDQASFAFRLACAVVLGLVIGLERDLKGKAAGVRTFATLCAASCLLGYVSTLTDWDPMRLAVGVVTGIGFLGAGAMIKDGASVTGLTTAAIIWAASAISLTMIRRSCSTRGWRRIL